MNPFSPLILAVVLVGLNAFFVAAEFAIIRVRPTRIDELAEQGKASAKAVQTILTHLDTFLSATQLGTTMTGLCLGIVGEPAMHRFLSPLFNLTHLGVNPQLSDSISLVVAFGLVTFFQVVFGELLPKWAVIEHTERAAFFVAYPMNFFARLFAPFVWLLENSARVLAQIVGLHPDKFGTHETAHSEDEIMAIVEAAEKSGTIGRSEAEIVDNVFEFAHTQVRDIMVPRVDIVYLSSERSIGKNIELALNSPFTRYPLCEGDVDTVIGMVHIKELLSIAGEPETDLRKIMRPIRVVPETKQIDELLRELQKNRSHQAIVLDEYGGTAGLVTLEDILEELVGEIQDEYDRPAPIETVGEHEWLFASTVPVQDVEHQLNLSLGENIEFDTIGGLALHSLHLAPRTGAQARLDGWDISVAEVDGNRITRLRFVRHAAEYDPEETSGQSDHNSSHTTVQ
jgi:CBS domain containing-hemolysin-like protein